MLVDDHKMIIDSLQLLFNLMEDVEVVHTEYDSRKVMPYLLHKEIDIAILDFRMPYIDGLQLTKLINEKHPHIKVIILSVNEDAIDIQHAFHAGASGYILKKASRKDLEDAVKTVASGKLYFGQDALQALLSKEDDPEENATTISTKLSSLTKRELEIVKLLSEELSSSAIGERLHISLGTVESHRHNILRKLNVKTTVGVIKFAIKTGIA